MNGFALPLGFEPGRLTTSPNEGYNVAYTAGEGDDPDTYTYQIAISHERVQTLCDRCFGLLPDEVHGIVEIGSRDAYRSVDVYLGAEPIPLSEFRGAWKHFEGFLLEDGSIAAGANAEEPFVEVFIDQRKMVMLHVPLPMQEDVDEILTSFGLDEVPETWPEFEESDLSGGPLVRPVLDVSEAELPDVDELLLQLRHCWRLELNLDREENKDEAGRVLGMTLWHVVVIVFKTGDEDGSGAYMTCWLTAGSLNQAEELVQDELERRPEWTYGDTYTIDRVAYDERPDEMADLSPRHDRPEIHLITLDSWDDEGPPESAGPASSPAGDLTPDA